MSHSKSPTAKQEAPVATTVADEAKSEPGPSAVTGTKKQAAAKLAKVPVKARASEPATDTGSESKKHTGKKPKLVRDSFTFPAADYARIAALKQRALKAGHEAKKSELLRAGLAVLSMLSDVELLQALNGIDKLKPGRPAR